MTLVFVHGRDQQGKDPVRLREEWIIALEKGLAKKGLELPVGVEIVLPFYGDLLNELTVNGGVAEVKDVIARGNAGTIQDAHFMEEFLSELKGKLDITDEDVLAAQTEPIERGALNWEWVQAILRELDKTRLGDLSLKQFTLDVFMYITMPGVRNAVNKIVNDSFQRDDHVVVGHSLGSVVGFNVLNSDPARRVKKYITVGSPLGLKSIRKRLPTPLKMPACLSDQWFNAYDPADVVALNPLETPYFPLDKIVNKRNVKNWTDNRHGIEGYLDDADVAETICKACTE